MTFSKASIIEFDATAFRRTKKKQQSSEQVELTHDVILPAPQTTVAKSDTSDLQSFMINFVVEQTGYPEEIVELDADLEGDLGIDSIKKVQLFAELGSHFEVEFSEDLTPDDFPTLRHIVDFLATHAKRTGTMPTHSAETTTSQTTSLDVSNLQSFMINFVVEQTGYPEEIVELDADLEGDLGIDSIKKVQLFAELGSHFEVSFSENLTPDDFPTLRHIVDFLAANAIPK